MSRFVIDLINTSAYARQRYITVNGKFADENYFSQPVPLKYFAHAVQVRGVFKLSRRFFE